MKYNRLLPLLIPIFVLILFEAFFYNPKIIYVSLVVANLLVFFTVSQFTKKSEISKSWFNFLILPALSITSLAAFSVLIVSNFFIQILFILNSIFLYLYFRVIYNYLLQPINYKNFTFENISSFGNFLTFFFSASVVYGLQSFLNISVWPLMIIVVIISFLIFYQSLWSNKINFKKSLIYILISSLVIVELAWSISFLSLNFKVAGLTLAICYYMLMGLVKYHLLDELDRKKIKLYLVFGFGSIIIVLLTSRWI